MKKILLFLLPIFLFSNVYADRGDYVADTLLDSYSTGELLGLFALAGPQIEAQVPCAAWDIPVTNGVDLYKLVYETVNVNGAPTLASGLLAIPTDYDCNAAIINYNHGTQNGGAISEAGTFADLITGGFAEWFISLPVGAGGYVVAMPDYLGYGQSACTDFHGYNHATSLGRDAADMIRATKEFCENNSVALSNELFITGYSEGGFAAMAATKEIQENLCDELQITASAPLSGAYNVYPLTRDTLLSPNYFNLTNLSYFTYSANNVCPNILGNGLSDVILPEYVELVEAAWNECNPMGELLNDPIFPIIAAEILDPNYVATITGDPCHPFNEMLRLNNLNNWIPNMPMRLYYTEADEQVPYTNAITTAAWMAAQGAQVTAHTLCGDSVTHSAFAIPSLLDTKLWFDDIRSECEAVVALDPNLCGPIPPASALCPIPGTFTPYVSFTLENGVVTGFETVTDSSCINNNIIVIIDTVYVVDTVEIVISDTVFVTDTLVMNDTIMIVDTVFINTAIGEIDWNPLQITLLGNPVHQLLNINLNYTEAATAQIAVYDVQGRPMLSNEVIALSGLTNFQKNVGALSAGIYLLEVRLDDGTRNIMRFVKD